MFNDLIISHLYDKFNLLHSSVIKTDDGYRTRCKICGDSKKSKRKARLNLYSKTNTVHCFNCDFTGTLLKYIAKVEGITQRDLKREIFSNNKINVKSQVSKTHIVENKALKSILDINDTPKIIEKLKFIGDENLPKEVKEYLDKRLVYSAPFWNKKPFLWDFRNKRIVIPWFFNNIPIYYQTRIFENNSQVKYLFPKKLKIPFYNLDMVNEKIPYLIICESALDAIFIKNGIAAGSLHFTRLQKDILEKFYSSYEKILLLDNPYKDKASFEKLQRLISSGYNGKIFIFPNNLRQYKDVNECVIAENNINIFSNINFILENTYTPAKALFLIKNFK